MPCHAFVNVSLLVASVVSLSAATASEFPITGASGAEYLVDFSGESGSEIVMTTGDVDSAETVITLDEGGSITTITVGTVTYTATHDANGEIDGVALAAGSATTRRAQQVDVAERRLGTCEEDCAANAAAACAGLATACATPAVADILGALCDDTSVLCNDAGLEAGCDRGCATRACNCCVVGCWRRFDNRSRFDLSSSLNMKST